MFYVAIISMANTSLANYIAWVKLVHLLIK